MCRNKLHQRLCKMLRGEAPPLPGRPGREGAEQGGRKRRAALAAGLAALLVAAAPWAGRAGVPAELRRTAVGSVPEGFAKEPVADARGAARYVEAYIRALGLEGVRVHRVVETADRYFVYVREVRGGREAFALEVRPDGAIRAKRFPGMYPEMMWNQKYGHRARRDPAMVREPVSLEEALERARRAVASEGLALGSPWLYYGYVLWPVLDPRGRLVGEVAVDRYGGGAAWERFPGGRVRVVEIPPQG